MEITLTFLLMCLPFTLASEAALEKFKASNNLFTASVYKEIQKAEKSNFLVSPFSAETVLALTQSGAKNETAQEIRTGLHLPDNQEEIEESVKSLQLIFQPNDRYKLKTANKIYIKNDLEIKDGFKKIATDVFDASLENIDFTKNIDAANNINKWTEEQTEHKIKNLIDSKQLNDKTRIILINALYFKGSWFKHFKSTSKEDFYKTSTEVVKVDTMHNSEFGNFYESPELKATFLEIPFEAGNVSMTFVLPKEKDGISALEGQLEKIFNVPQYKSDFVKMSIPKFKIESKIDFKKILQELGVKKAFEAFEADFSGIAGEKGNLIIDEVIQKTFVNVNEDGVEAAAVTYTVGARPFVKVRPNREFIADHPFIFYIKVKDVIIFVGRVMEPSY